jgi:hypothetical protein
MIPKGGREVLKYYDYLLSIRITTSFKSAIAISIESGDYSTSLEKSVIYSSANKFQVKKSQANTICLE